MSDYAELKRLADIAAKYEWTRKSLDLGDKFPSDYEGYMVGCSPKLALSLIAENEALRKDAERWRWLREKYWIQEPIDFRIGDSNSVPEMEILIDAAMSKEP